MHAVHQKPLLNATVECGLGDAVLSLMWYITGFVVSLRSYWLTVMLVTVCNYKEAL
jgi:hypothetical protein